MLPLQQIHRFVCSLARDEYSCLQHFGEGLIRVERQQRVCVGFGFVQIPRTQLGVAPDEDDGRMIRRQQRKSSRLFVREIEIATKESELGHCAEDRDVGTIQLVSSRERAKSAPVVTHLQLKLAKFEPIIGYVLLRAGKPRERP